MKPFITFTTYYDQSMKDCGDFLSEQLKQYAFDRNHFFIKNYEKDGKVDGRHPSWRRLFKTSEILAKGSILKNGWLISVDADCLLLNQNYDMSFLSSVSSDVSVLVAKDWNGVFCAATAYRMDVFSQWLVDSLYRLGDIYPEMDDEFGVNLGPKSEQNTLKVLTKYFRSVNDKIGFLPESFILDEPSFDKSPFLWHYAGAVQIEDKIRHFNAAKEKLAIFEKSLEKIHSSV